MKENRISPPQWAIRFLEWFCPPELLEGILGDLLEAFDQDSISIGPKKARRNFTLQVFRLFHPSILFRNHLNYSIMNTAIIRNHLLIAGRQIRKHWSFALINILGLSLALTFLILSYFFIQQERSYDQFHEHKTDLYRLFHTSINKETGTVGNQSAVTAVPLGEVVAAEVPAIQAFTRVASSSGLIRNNKDFNKETISFTDPQFLQMFSFPMKMGDPQTALRSPRSIVLSEDLAKKYFGNQNPLSKELEVTLNDSLFKVVVTGVIEPLKESSSLQLDCILPFEHYGAIIPPKMFNSFNFGVVENYIQVRKDVKPDLLPPSLTAAVKKMSAESEDRLEIGLQPLPKLRFAHEIRGNTPYTNPQKLYILFAITLLVLAIALINFITLSSGQALGRLQEMGLRKTLGARGGQIRNQLMIESLVITGFAAMSAVALAYLLSPNFAQLVDAPITVRISWRELLLLSLLVVSIATISSLGQGLLLLRQQTAPSLKGEFSGPVKRQWFNEGLIIFQFALSIMLILGAFHIQRQLDFILEKDLGFDKERLLELPLGDSPDAQSMQQKVNRLREELSRNEQILAVSSSMNNSTDPWTELFFKQVDGDEHGLYFNQVDQEYLKTMGIDLLEGKSFPPQLKKGILVNEALVQHFGWEDPLVQQIPGINFTDPHEIIGVFKDFHYSSLHQEVEPLILAIDPAAISSGITGLSTYIWPPNLYNLLIRIGPGEIGSILQFIEERWQEHSPETPFQFKFVDETLAAKYAEEERWGKVITLSSRFGILIAWLGLFALINLTVRKRTRELGIRKVLGASPRSLMSLLSGKYLKLLSIGTLVAFPLAWHFLDRWLASFSYSIELTPLLFLLIGIAVLLLTALVFSIQSYQASRINPVTAMRVE